jgi:hypothetical protein
MVIDMNETRLETIEQIREFLAGTADIAFVIALFLDGFPFVIRGFHPTPAAST